MRRKSNKSRNGARNNVLHARVWSTRMLRIGIFKFLFRCAVPVCVLALLGALGWGIQQGLQRGLYNNPDFRLQVVDLNPNPAIDELDFIKITGIDLRANLFRLDLPAITARLTSQPEIAAATVERRLPATLVVRVTARTPLAWIACQDAGSPAVRKAGAMLVDGHNVAYPCPPRQLEVADPLPIIVLPARDKEPIAMGKPIQQPELQRCLRLLATCGEGDPEAPRWIDSIKQANAWSLALTTREGTVATLGLGDHARQIANLRAALKHATNKGYTIATINLIPKENVPVTVVGTTAVADTAGTTDSEAPPPRAIPVAEPTPLTNRQDRHARDLKALINRD
jgi:cell division septal protein FtsQ